MPVRHNPRGLPRRSSAFDPVPLWEPLLLLETALPARKRKDLGLVEGAGALATAPSTELDFWVRVTESGVGKE